MFAVVQVLLPRSVIVRCAVKYDLFCFVLGIVGIQPVDYRHVHIVEGKFLFIGIRQNETNWFLGDIE